jgi:multidrug transporter EmrE-like cation transporter
MMAERPAGVTAVAAAFLLAAAYLLVIGLTMLARPGVVSMAAGAPLLGGLELDGPYMFLLMAGVGSAVAIGLWRLHRWARWTAILIAMAGVVLLVPSVSSAMLDFRIGKLLWDGLGTILRVLIAWYLFQELVGEAFAPK